MESMEEVYLYKGVEGLEELESFEETSRENDDLNVEVVNLFEDQDFEDQDIGVNRSSAAEYYSEQENQNNAQQNSDEQHDFHQIDPTVGMCFPLGEEYAKFCHDYAYKGLLFFTRTARLIDAYKEQGIKRTQSGEKETSYHMMKQLRFVCKKGGRKQTDGSSVTDCKVFVHANMVDGDAIALEEYFRKQHDLNNDFYSSIQRDCDRRLMNVFWSDARIRAMCEDFGDIITFDTMYQTNRNLGNNKNWKHIEVALRVVVHECLDPDEFDEAWAAMVSKFNIGENSWIQESYALREGVQSALTPRCLVVQLYEAAMGDVANTEHKLNFASADSPLVVDKTILAEYVFHNKYTNTKFKEVRDEALGIRHTHVMKTKMLGTVSFFKADEKISTPIYRKRWKSYNVTIDNEKGDFSCSCELFEFRGILCKHIIRVIELEDIEFIPENYILSRWRKDIVRRYEDLQASNYDLESEQVQKVRELSVRHKYLTTLAMHNDATFAMYMKSTDNIRIELEASMGIERNENDAYCWWDQSSRKVFGRRRLGPTEDNERHLRKKVVAVKGGTKDPIDKRHTGRGKNSRIPNPS
ncbi:Protein FAR1-RELATED SEQUENCE 12 [Bienertia sinuspersici]